MYLSPGYKNWVKNDRHNFEFPSFLSPVGNLEREASKRYFEFSRPGFLHLEDKKVGSILYLIFIYTMLPLDSIHTLFSSVKVKYLGSKISNSFNKP